MDVTSLINVVNEILNDQTRVGPEKNAKYVHKYPEISARYPIIIKKVTEESDFDLARLEWMIGMLRKVEDKSITQYDASIKVGEKLVDEHIKPLLNTDRASK
jgi:hypothetical protein